MIVEDVAKQVGGSQCIEVTDDRGNVRKFSLDFNCDIIMIKLREPTQEDLMALRVI